jgi:hypothetical protein
LLVEAFLEVSLMGYIAGSSEYGYFVDLGRVMACWHEGGGSVVFVFEGIPHKVTWDLGNEGAANHLMKEWEKCREASAREWININPREEAGRYGPRVEDAKKDTTTTTKRRGKKGASSGSAPGV